MITRLLAVATTLATVSVTTLLAQEPTKEPEAKQETRPFALMVGDPAPPLSIQEWVKGDPIEAFAKDTIYVVEFWATWCGPCIAGMPHLSELQEHYAEQGVRIVGVNIWDDPKRVAPFLSGKVKMHDKPGSEVMRYTVAIEKKDDPENLRVGVMAKQWMQAAGREGIPSAFVVDRDGRIAWIGHPANIDTALAKIIADEWDLAVQAKVYADELAAAAEIKRYQALFAAKNYDEAYPLGMKLVKGPLANNANELNTLAWRIVDPDAMPDRQDLDLALAAAERANELAESKNEAILDTLAKVHYDRGELAKALEFQRLAAKYAKGSQFEREINARLKQYEKEAEEGGGQR